MAEQEEKGPLEKPIDWLSGWKASFGRIRQRFGLPAAILLALAVTCGLVWWNWDDIARRPGVEWGIAHLRQHTVPAAAAGRLTIAVARLEDDKDREQEKLLLDGMSHDLEGVDTLAVDRLVEWPDSGTEQARRKEAEARARGLLKQSGADVLIWGSVISLGGKSALRLYWTPSREISGAKESEKYLPQTETVVLPDAFWTDLKQILGLLTQTRLAAITIGQEGHFTSDQLAPLIEQVRALAESKNGVWNPETLAGVRFSLAAALYAQGEQSARNGPLEESVELLHKVLDQWSRERDPRDWAMAENNLGIALWTLSTRGGGAAQLEESAAAFRESLKELTRESAPRQWAMAQNNLGFVLWTLSTQGGGAAPLVESIAAYREALREFTRESDPRQWAIAQTNLGAALKTLGDHESGEARLNEAVITYHEALKELTRERDPRQWATAQTGLGAALKTLGDRESGETRLNEAVTAYRNALQEYTRERAPLDWAQVQLNLTSIYMDLFAKSRDPQHLSDALQAVDGVLEEYRKAKTASEIETVESVRAQILAVEALLHPAADQPGPAPAQTITVAPAPK
jgi:tetratricopeptide (TPR) repeat protein